MPLTELIDRHAPAWTRMVAHPFVVAVGDGSLPEKAFDTWLAQDHRFVADLLTYQSTLLARAPRPAQAVLAGGLVALVDELDWFERVGGERGISVDADRLPATAAYHDLLVRLARAPFPVALGALWTVERAYLDAWRRASPGAGAYREFVAHWTAPEFAAYVDRLAVCTDALDPAPDTASGAPLDEAFVEVVAAETAFWEMAWAPGA